MTVSFVFLLLVALLASVQAQIPCDDAYGTHCPEAAGWGVGECLKKLDASTLSADCLQYIAMSDTCKADILHLCPGNEYTGDAFGLCSYLVCCGSLLTLLLLSVCLSEWQKPEALTPECLAALPKRNTKEKSLSEEEKKKAAKRRK